MSHLSGHSSVSLRQLVVCLSGAGGDVHSVAPPPTLLGLEEHQALSLELSWPQEFSDFSLRMCFFRLDL